MMQKVTARRCAFFAFIGVAAMLGLAVAGFAGDVTITFTGPAPGVPNDTYGGFYVGIYEGTVTVKGVATQSEFVCDDFLHDIGGGQHWSATQGGTDPTTGEFSPATNPNLNPDIIAWENQYAQPFSQQDEYNAVTYLANEIFKYQDNQEANTDLDWRYLSWAIWSITDGAWTYGSSDYGVDFGPSYSQEVRDDVNDALDHSLTSNGDLVLYTPNDQKDQGGQEFLGPQNAPEASSALLLGILMVVGAVLLLTRKPMPISDSGAAR